MFRRLFPGFSLTRWLPEPTPRRRRASGLTLEALEIREVPAVTLATISQPQIPSDKPVFVPVTVTNTPNGAVTVTATSNNPSGVSVSVLQGGRSVEFTISGVDGNNVPFTGTLTIRLFEDVAPLGTQRIVDLVTSGFYNGKNFHRVSDLFSNETSTTPDTDTRENVIIQGGSPTGNGSGGSSLPDLPDEYRADVTFVSGGLVAFANATDDNNNSQFFITDVGRPLSEQIQFLNFNHTIFGIVTDGFDTLAKMRSTPRSGSTPNSPGLTINSARVFTDAENAVLKLTPNGSFTGTADITVTASDADPTPATQTFSVAGVNDNFDTPKPFITTPVPNQTTTAGTPVTFTVPVTEIDGDAVTIAVRAGGSGFAGTPANVTVSINQQTRQVTVTPNAGFTGTTTFKVGVRQTNQADSESNYDTQLVTLTVNAAATTDPSNPTTPDAGTFTAEGSASGASGSVTVRNADGSVRFTVPVFDGFSGGIRVATGDVNNDGKEDIVAVPGFGGGPVVVVIDSTTGQITRTVTVFDPSFRGGLHVQVGDAFGLGYDQVLVGAGDSGGPRVTLLDMVRSRELLNFFAGDANFRGGVDVDVAEVFQGKGQMIVTGLGPGRGPTVALFNATTAASVGSFAAGDQSNLAGIRVRAGEPNSEGVRPIFVAPLNAPDGTGETEFDPSDFIDPNKPATTSGTSGISTSSSGTSGFDLNSLFSN